jgi:transcriptional regulator with GAF, ATPase, and Fis domain
MGTGPVLAEGDLSLGTLAAEAHAAAGPGEDNRLVERLMNSEIPFEQFERELLVRALRRTRGNQTRAARLLGMTRRTLQYRIDKFSIDTSPLRDG